MPRKPKPMVLETPVLAIFKKHYVPDGVKRGGRAIACQYEICRLFGRCPEAMSLEASSAYVKGGVKMYLTPILHADYARVTIPDIGWDAPLMIGLDPYLNKFMDAGHTTIWVTCWEHC